MSEPRGRLCPECKAPRAVDNTPSCGCGPRASEALRDARTAEAAAAEDFDPLRIRPYVELDDANDADPAETMELRPIQPRRQEQLPPAPNAQDLSLFETNRPSDDGNEETEESHREAPPQNDHAPRRHRRTLLLGAGGAVVAVIAAAGLASGVFTYEAPTRSTALPDDVRASVPAPSTSQAPEPAAPAKTTTPSTPPPTSASPTQSPTSSPSPSRSTTSPTPTASAEPTRTPSASQTTGSQADDSAAVKEPTAATLRRGDRGPEVTELELRLTQLGLYTRQARGNYNEGVEDAVARYQWARGVQPEEYGVYDPETRERLESETWEP
ncbi:peptidoglycan-binding domain-containing protein [Streptomyces sp. NPDC098781]|uniref:peptidoglycan-binding domain-containing protein n=1 Tax=Streptomyces sp. NPDC098781 TaxID=3366097 RepID=UPI003814EA4D